MGEVIIIKDVCDALAAAAAVLDTNGRVMYANPVFDALTDGIQCLDERWIDDLLREEEERPQARHAFVDVVTGRIDVEQVAGRLATRNDDTIWTLIAIGRTENGADGVMLLGQSTEVASFEQRQLQDLRHALDQSSIVAITDQKGLIQYVNDKFCQISGYSREELLGQDHRLLNSGYHSTEHIRSVWRTIARGDVWRGEFRNRAKDGSIYWVDTTIVPFVNRLGKPYQYLAIRNDITERKAAQTQLTEQRTLARLGEMSAVIAHEVKNPLAGISGALQIIASRMDSSTMEHKVLMDAQERLKDLAGSLEQLLDFARPRRLVVDEIDIAELVMDTARLVRADPQFSRANIQVSTDECTAVGDAQAMREAFLNLALNGLQATGGNGALTIELHGMDRSYSVVFSDDGPGIDDDKRARVFEPFFSTKTRGTGLGLATVRRTVERHGGSVELTCPDSGGTIFELTLPRHPPERQ